ncbi:MAG: flagellar M-ring protein FliF [Gemmatimonadales bacterium]|nr:flagellar M-ring protein FliF [Gemmatimonadales bacterium]
MIDAVRRLNGNRRFLVLAIIAVLAVPALVVGRWATAPQYVVLFQQLDLQDTGTMTEKLDKAGIVYRLADGGGRLEVGLADAAKARVLLAKEGLPSRGNRPGMELFDKPTWGMTEFTQRITYRRALEGELARTIGSLREVEHAQVHLALPESSPLRKMERPAEAAVVLTLRPNVAVTPEMVRGIALLVSSSVEQLSSDHVAVLDDRGRLLAVTAEAGDGLTLSTRQLELQQAVEQHLAGKVTELLTAVVGTGRVRAQVSARLNFTQVDRTTEEYDPDRQVLANEQHSEGGAAESDAAVGAPTVVNNTYLNSRRIEKLIGDVGNVTRLTVSVMVDSSALSGGEAGGLRSRLEQLTRNAVGFDSTRGDALVVVSLPFGAPTLPEAVGLPDSTKSNDGMLVMAERLSRPVLTLLALLAVFALAWRALKPSAGGSQVAGTLPASAPPLEAMPSAAAAPAQAQLRGRIRADSLDTPATAAKVFRAWLAEDT